MLIMNRFALIMACGFVASCTQVTPKYDAKFGVAVKSTMQQQIINTDAGNNADPVAGLDGKAANDVMNRYNKSYRAPEKNTNVFNIGIGSGSSGQ